MNKAQIIAHTKNYMDMLSQGIDPISREKIADDSIVTQPRMQKCFAFIAEVFDEMLKNNGFVALTPDAAQRFEIVEKKRAFALSEEQKCKVFISRKPVTLNVFLKNINRAVDIEHMEKLSSKSVNAWLLDKGYVTESKEPATIHRTVRHTSEKAAGIGIAEADIVDERTGEIKRQMMLSEEAQAYLLAHLEEITGAGI